MNEERCLLNTDKGDMTLIMRQKHWGSRKVWSLVIDKTEVLVDAVFTPRRMIFASSIKRASQFKANDVFYGKGPDKFKKEYNKANSVALKSIFLRPISKVAVKSVSSAVKSKV
ncbi:hypothetical protein HN592_01320 [Candidatus Woesearchaeota archaeon]|jgi:hypothetical protein|nr:hypothetical protein [Candidatus Woesearchaeota archaeon]MBT4368651.1 hypothetical protein [Candidatus Woesearchaeota archaeon]MBT4712206.1 hypothetical protein [Candidatus Woesearchaeota archaeon]MBT6638962.1 hypothetical protein [Candidatus Woesearchaeota archaeon]MBT7134136.1 hypothetical protein [Candidatus Woesearchaeota archaeon]